MFIWVEVLEGIDMMVLLEKVVVCNVVFVLGVLFYVNVLCCNILWLVFVMVVLECIE